MSRGLRNEESARHWSEGSRGSREKESKCKDLEEGPSQMAGKKEAMGVGLL